MADSPASAEVGVVALLAASSCGKASEWRVSASLEATVWARNLREEEEQDEEDSDYACEKHPATPAIPSAVAVVSITAVEDHVSLKVGQIHSDERICRSSSTCARNGLTYNSHSTGEVQDSRWYTCRIDGEFTRDRRR